VKYPKLGLASQEVRAGDFKLGHSRSRALAHWARGESDGYASAKNPPIPSQTSYLTRFHPREKFSVGPDRVFGDDTCSLAGRSGRGRGFEDSGGHPNCTPQNCTKEYNTFRILGGIVFRDRSGAPSLLGVGTPWRSPKTYCRRRRARQVNRR